MATYTENFNLIKPEDEEYYDVADFNANMDVIDEALAENAGGSEMLQGVISADGQGVRIIKSIQRVHFRAGDCGSTANNYFTVSYPLQTVDPSRCILLTERIRQGHGELTPLTPTLQADSLLVNFYNVGSIEAAFQIVEFY